MMGAGDAISARKELANAAAVEAVPWQHTAAEEGDSAEEEEDSAEAEEDYPEEGYEERTREIAKEKKEEKPRWQDEMPQDEMEAVKPHALLWTLNDLFGRREGPAAAIRALVARVRDGDAVHAAPTLRKVVHHAHRRGGHRRGRAHVLNARERHRSKRFLLNQAPLALFQFGEGKFGVTEMLDELCTQCVGSILSAAAGVVLSIHPFLKDLERNHVVDDRDVKMNPDQQAGAEDFVKMAEYLPMVCRRGDVGPSADYNPGDKGEVCIAAPLRPVLEPASLAEAGIGPPALAREAAPTREKTLYKAHGTLTPFVERGAVCGECGLSRARVAVGLASTGFIGTRNHFDVPSHPLFALAATSPEPYAAS